jgi:DNA-binding XRE family transcriptional regulator
MPSKQELSVSENAHLRLALRSLVEKFGTQKALADQLDVTPTTISTILAGKNGASFVLARRVADLVGVHVLALLGGESMKRDGNLNPTLLVTQIQSLQVLIMRLATALGPDVNKTNPAAFQALLELNEELSRMVVSMVPGGAMAMLGGVPGGDARR